MQQWDVVIIGAGIAGVHAARAAAEQAPDSSVLLVNAEQAPPYKRTKLSKSISGGFDPAEWQLNKPEWYRQTGIELINQVRAESIDPGVHQVKLSNGEQIEYRRLVLATGASPRFPPVIRAGDERAFFVVRSADDVRRLTGAAGKAKRILIAGIGVLGIEVADQLRSMKKQVTMVGSSPQVMPRQLNARAGEIMEDLLRGAGVRLNFQEELLSFEKRGKGSFAVSMIRDSGVFDMIVVCIGVRPQTELADAAGIDTDVGVLVDEQLRTSASDVYAAGDVAQHPNGLVTGLWHSAEHQGEVAGRNAAGAELVAEPGSYRLKCEVFGAYFFSVNKPADERAYHLDEMENGERYRCLYYDDAGALFGVIMVNDRERAKVYEQAARERWPRERVDQELPF